ncbi:hypothetical protein KI387_013195, partial [Taxus chinensis]
DRRPGTHHSQPTRSQQSARVGPAGSVHQSTGGTPSQRGTGGCFICGAPDHYVRMCPQKPTTTDMQRAPRSEQMMGDMGRTHH